MRAKHEAKSSQRIFPLIKGPCGDIQKWNLKIRRSIKKIVNKEGTEGEYLDLDMTISLLMEEFKTQRRLFQRDLAK